MYVLYVAVFTTYMLKALKYKALSADVRFVRCLNTHYIYRVFFSKYEVSDGRTRA